METIFFLSRDFTYLPKCLSLMSCKLCISLFNLTDIAVGQDFILFSCIRLWIINHAYSNQEPRNQIQMGKWLNNINCVDYKINDLQEPRRRFFLNYLFSFSNTCWQVEGVVGRKVLVVMF